VSLASPALAPKVLVPLAPGFEELEVVAPVDVLRRAGAEVTLATLDSTLAVRGRNGLTLVADTRWDALGEGAYNCLLLPGGPAVALLRRHAGLLARVRAQDAAGGWLAAICAAPTVVQDAGVLGGRRHTAHPSVAGELPRADGGASLTLMQTATIEQIAAKDLASLWRSNPNLTVIDVRTPAEFESVRARGAKLHPLHDLNARDFSGRGSDHPVYILCKSGVRATQAAEQLLEAGVDHPIVVPSPGCRCARTRPIW
jgi:4-methyl-5(b-hydroxyethyl)-thiazole monophosphate biosynthesis